MTLAAAAGFQGRWRGRFNWREGKEDTGGSGVGGGGGGVGGGGGGVGGGGGNGSS